MNAAAGAASLSRLHDELSRGRFVITAEVSPPVSTDPGDFLAKADALKGLVTAVNVTDGAGAKAHLSSMVAAHFLTREGIEPILQITCRDRNRIAIQGDLLGAAALGIRNVLVLGGDDPKAGDQPETKAVYDLSSSQLLAMADRMRREQKLPPGTEIKGGLKLVLGGADVPVDPPPDWEPKGLIAKARAGADFIQTQFCFDAEVARRYAARLMQMGIAQKLPVLIGVGVIPSARSARWMKERLFGTILPERLIERLERAADPKEEGKAICVELLRELAAIPGIAGAHIMAPMFPSAVPEVIAASGLQGKARAR